MLKRLYDTIVSIHELINWVAFVAPCACMLFKICMTANADKTAIFRRGLSQLYQVPWCSYMLMDHHAYLLVHLSLDQRALQLVPAAAEHRLICYSLSIAEQSSLIYLLTFVADICAMQLKFESKCWKILQGIWMNWQHIINIIGANLLLRSVQTFHSKKIATISATASDI